MSEPPVQPALTKRQQYANALYDLFDQGATVVELDGETPDDPSIEVRTWTGLLTAACNSVGIPVGVGTKVLTMLAHGGCIEIAQRGVKGHPSVVILNKPPTADIWAEIGRADYLTRPPTAATLDQSLQNFLNRLGGLDIVESFRNHEKRISELEAKIAELDKIAQPQKPQEGD